MARKFFTEGITYNLTQLKAAYTTLYLRLYTNTTIPADAATLASFTSPSGNGYAPIALASADWTVSGKSMTNVEKTFAASGGNWGSCYGYYIATTSDNTGVVICAEDFSGGARVINDGSSQKVTAKITGQNSV